MDEIRVDYQKDMRFEAYVDGFAIPLDAAPEHGGADSAPRPKPLMLVALAGCTGMDIASLARKMRVELKKMSIDVRAEKSDEMPVVYTSAALVYNFEADEKEAEKLLKMVDLSQERYCGVAAMMRSICPLSVEVRLNGTQIR